MRNLSFLTLHIGMRLELRPYRGLTYDNFIDLLPYLRPRKDPFISWAQTVMFVYFGELSFDKIVLIVFDAIICWLNFERSSS